MCQSKCYCTQAFLLFALITPIVSFVDVATRVCTQTTHTQGHTHTLPKDLCSFGNCVASFCFVLVSIVTTHTHTPTRTQRLRRALTHAHFSMRIANICIVKFSCCTKCIFTQDFSQLQLQFWLLLFQFLCLLVLRLYSFRWPTRCEWVLVSKWVWVSK